MYSLRDELEGLIGDLLPAGLSAAPARGEQCAPPVFRMYLHAFSGFGPISVLRVLSYAINLKKMSPKLDRDGIMGSQFKDPYI